MKNICDIDLQEFFKCEDFKKCVPFNCEMTFQFYLAWFLKENLNNAKVEFEKNVYQKSYTLEDEKVDKRRCDLYVEYIDKNNNKKKALLELKYVIEGNDQNNEKDKTSCGARKSFMKDLYRLKNDPFMKNYDEKYCIFVTNKSAVFKKPASIQNSKKSQLINFYELFSVDNIIDIQDGICVLNQNNKWWYPTNWEIPNNKKKNKFYPYALIVNVDKDPINEKYLTNNEITISEF